MDPESAAFYETARLVMTAEEREIFNHLPDADTRLEFIHDFWAKRDPDPDTPENEFRVEFEARVDYANKRFREGGRGFNTDRGRIYIFMGPPDKFDEQFTHGDPGIRGPIVYWTYYRYELVIEFVDERGTGEYRIRRYEGGFFQALDNLKLGQSVRAEDVFRKPFVDFDVRYDAAAGEITVILPADALAFKEDESGRPALGLDFKFYVYEDGGARKQEFTERRTFATTDAELPELREVTFTFARRLPPGTNYVDVIISGPKGGAADRVRKVFKVKV